MLAIRMQRTGRSRHAQFRVIVQDSHFSPVRGRVVAYLGSYNPHTKAANLDTEKTIKYLDNGAQPSDRVARLLQKEGIKLPDWVKLEEPKQRQVRNADKRRSTQPAQETPAPAEAPETPSEEVKSAETEPAEGEAQPAESHTEESAGATNEAEEN